MGLLAWALAELLEPRGVRVGWLWWPLGAFLALSTLSAVASPFPQFAYLGKWFHYQGLLTLWAYAGACFLLAQVADRRFLLTWVRAGTVAGGLVALYGVLQSFGIDAANWLAPNFQLTRSFSTWSNPDFFGGYLLFPLAFSAAVAGDKDRRWRAVGIATLLVVGYAIVSSLTRAAWLVGFLTAAAMFVLYIRRGAHWRRVLAISGVVLVAVLVLVTLTSGGALQERLTSAFTAEDSGTGGRIQIWRESLPYTFSYPLLGSGPDTFQDGLYLAKGTLPVPDNPHDIVLFLLVTLGVPATVVILGFATGVLVRSRRAAFAPDADGQHMALAAVWVATVAHAAYLLAGISMVGSTALLFACLGLLSASAMPRQAIQYRVPLTLIFLTVALAMVCCTGYFGTRALLADHAYLEARLAFRAGRDEVAPAERAVRLNPLNPRYQQELEQARTAR
jgi:O-antigen ligase